jgi:hypothetical protein
MKSVASEFVRFLADPDWSETEFRALERLVLSEEAKTCLEAARHLRRQTREVLRHFEGESVWEESVRSNPQSSVKGELADAVFSRVRDLLLDEARLSSSAAIAALNAELPGVKRPNPRTSLRNAVEYFLSVADGSAVLSAAQRVRNKAIHGGFKHPWPLDDKSTP